MSIQFTFQPRVPVFDANVRVGDLHYQPSPCRSRDQLLSEMDRHGVEKALIYHAQTEEVSPFDGNGFLEAWLDDSRLFPQWSIMPTPDSLAQVQALHEQGRVHSVRLHNARSVGLPFRPWSCGAMLTWLSDNRIPLWIPLPDADADELAMTLSAFPELVTVLVGAHYSHALWVRPLMTTLPNSYLELSRIEPLGEVEALCGEYGAERFVYGSWYDRLAMGTMLYYLHHTDISESELELICAGNLLRILQGEGRHD
jgi:hypothetical protein